jgi:hypothetical protein
MSLLPPLLPEVDGSRPAAGRAAPVIRLGATVVASAGSDALIDTGHGRALLQGAPSLRAGAAVVLELPHAAPAPARTGRLVAVDQHRFEPPLPIRVQTVSPARPAATVRSAGTLDVSLRPLGADGRPTMPAFTARLVVPAPEPGSGTSGSGAPPSGGAASRGSVSPGASRPAAPASPSNTAVAPVTSRPAAAPTGGLPGPSAGSAAAAAAPASAPVAMADPPGLLAAQSRTIEVIALARDALGRTLLRGAGFSFRADTPVDLPVGARLQLILPAGLVRSSPAPLQAGALEAVRTLAALPGEQAGTEEQADAGTLRLPEPTATLAARLLRLVQLIAPRSGDANVRSPAEPAPVEGPPGAARIAAALTELGRLAAEPQSGGWRVLLLPLGFAGTPLLRLYLREYPCDEDDGGKDRQADRSPVARRAVFELEYSELGRCQIDVLCQARRFDLLVRTEESLRPHLRRDLRELYLAAREAAGLVGEIRFRAGGLVALPGPIGAGGAGGGVTV